MIVFTSLSFWGMNIFGFQNNPHDILWSLGGIRSFNNFINKWYIYLRFYKETPWTWKNKV